MFAAVGVVEFWTHETAPPKSINAGPAVPLRSSRVSSALLGYEPAELIGRPISMVIDEVELASARQAVADVLGGDGSERAGGSVQPLLEGASGSACAAPSPAESS